MFLLTKLDFNKYENGWKHLSTRIIKTFPDAKEAEKSLVYYNSTALNQKTVKERYELKELQNV